MHKLKSTILTVLLGIGLAAGITFAASLWQGTDWIADGEIISASKIKDNLDFLYERVGGSAIPLCVGSDEALQWDGASWLCTTLSDSGGAVALIGGTYDSDDCVTAGGTAYEITAGWICKVSASSCPSGWSKYNNWTTTAPRTCTGTISSGTSGGCTLPSCTTSSHAFSDASSETCSYSPTTQKSGFICLESAPITCTASRTEIGCI